MPDTDERDTQGRVGYTRQDYETAADEYSSVSEASREMGVSRQVIIEQWKRYGIVNPYTGRVPGQNDAG